MSTPAKSAISVCHDGTIQIATGRSRKETDWKNIKLQWSELLSKLSRTTRTRETQAQYRSMTKEQQGRVKDTGGFVGGLLKCGRRKATAVGWRSMLTLDADFATMELIGEIELLFGNAAAIYSTHSHTPENPRLRVVVPLARQVKPDEYQALSRFIAAELGIDNFDDTTYEPHRLMYWPSSPDDGEFIFKYLDGPWMDPDEILGRHPEWQDASTWPESTRSQKKLQRQAEKQGDPATKPGVIGAFCRSYTVPDAIEKFIPEVYTECETPNRYTYAAGSASAGLVIYDGDHFAYSHHGTDPTGGQLCNAFDLVRIHKFGIKDEDAKPDTPINRLPSYKEMTAWALTDDKVKIELANTRNQSAAEDFSVDLQDDSWKAKLTYSERGGILQTINNTLLILRNDEGLKGRLGYDEFSRRHTVRKSLPWRKIKGVSVWTDADDSGLRHYLEHVYGIKGRDNIGDAVTLIMQENTYHPIRDFLNGLVWDGQERLDAVLIDYLGAADTNYTREVARKWMASGVARILEPGCKFDYMLILVGSQGIGKSQFLSRITMRPGWFSDSLSKFDNTKEAMEQLSGKWIFEIGELASMKRSEVEQVKIFLSKQEDSYRQSYGRRVENFPRQCVFAGTTNRDDFLHDVTGGRRFWPVYVTNAARMWQEMTPEVVEQLWAEAAVAYTMGEQLYFDDDTSKEAAEVQAQYMEGNGKAGIAEEFLEKKITHNWDELTIKERVDYLNGYGFGEPGEVTRNTISGIELFVECFGGRIDDYKTATSYEMTNIMIQLGWVRSKQRPRLKGYGQQRVFTRPEGGTKDENTNSKN